MLADDWAGDARNPFPGTVFGSALRTRNLFLDDIQARPRRWYTVAGASTSRQQCTECDAQQVDYSGQDVTVANFLSVLTDQHPSEHTPASRRLRSTPADHVLVYLTGHGGNGFLKFQDLEELTAARLAGAVGRARFRRLLLVLDTCQAASLAAALAAPGVAAMASSAVGEDSYSHHADEVIGVPIIDRFTFYLAHFLCGLAPGSNATLQDLADYLRRQPLASTVRVRGDLLAERMADLRVTAFFGGGGGPGSGPPTQCDGGRCEAPCC